MVVIPVLEFIIHGIVYDSKGTVYVGAEYIYVQEYSLCLGAWA